MFNESDYQHMARAIQLAKQPVQSPHPNPRVGCVITKDDNVLGEGFHAKTGEPHAEIMAMRDAGESLEGATVYVTLEPCVHTGRTPPCVNALLETKVKKVVMAMKDPNPKVAGKGMQVLQRAGIECQLGLLEAQARALNPGFIKRMQTGLPWVRSKIAMSVDGRTALANGESQWITGPAARKDVQQWRAKADAILTGSGTVLKDKPLLTLRDIDCNPIRQPLRVILDSQLNIPANARILKAPGSVILANIMSDSSQKYDDNVRLWKLPANDTRVELKDLLTKLGQEEINEVHVEAGPTLNGALFSEKLIDELVIYIAPVLLGDKARAIFELPELESMQNKHKLECKDVRQVGSDTRFIYNRAG